MLGFEALAVLPLAAVPEEAAEEATDTVTAPSLSGRSTTAAAISGRSVTASAVSGRTVTTSPVSGRAA